MCNKAKTKQKVAVKQDGRNKSIKTSMTFYTELEKNSKIHIEDSSQK